MSEPRRRPAGEVVGGKYRLVRFLASGGMGSVYEAQHTVVKRRFAVKFLRADLAVERASLARFQREAQAAGALESEHIAAALDFGIADDGSPFIVMEYLVGESLASLFERDKPMPVGRAVDLVLQACRGVETAHASGIVHRDLKPQNLFVARREDGTDLVKVLDFGVAKLEAEEQGAGTTKTGTVLGTPAYMSPEQARGDREIDQRSDVYALGAILYELLSGEKPHPGDSPNAVLYHIATQSPPPLEGATPDLPSELVTSIERALSREPAERQASATELSEALRRFAVREVHPAPVVPPSAPLGDSMASTELASQGGPSLAVSAVDTKQPATPEKARPAAAGALVWLAIGAGLAAAIGWASRQGGGEAPAEATAPPPAHPTATGSVAPPLAGSRLEAEVTPTGARPTPPPSASTGAATDPAPPSPLGRPLGRPDGRPTADTKVNLHPVVSASEATAPSASSRFDQRNPYE
jgi:serine/threonine-protein kinase